jgi:hypothetical protein
MDTNLWGPGAWVFLHSVTFNYPTHPTKRDMKQTKEFFHSLKGILPCPTCQEHYREGIEETMPMDSHLKNRDTLTRWLVKFHNSVNKRLGKPQMPYNSVRAKYEAMRGKHCQIVLPPSPGAQCDDREDTYHKNEKSWLLWIICILLIMLILLCAANFYCKQRNRRK